MRRRYQGASWAAFMMLLSACSGLGTQTLATVNGQPIEQSQLYEYMLKRYGSRSLLNLITAAVIEQAAQKAQLTVSDAEIDAAIAKKRRSIDLTAIETGVDFERMLFLEKKTLPLFRETERTLLLLTKLVAAEAAVTEEEVQKYYQEHLTEFRLAEAMRVSYIRMDDREQLTEVRQAIIAGTQTFDEAARMYSNDPLTKDAGGKLDRWLRRGNTPFLQTAFTLLKDGDISDIVPFPYLGYYLIRRDQYVRDFQLDYADVKDDLRLLLENEKKQRLAMVKQQELLRAADIQFLIQWPEGSFMPPKPEEATETTPNP
ncbi:MAG: foldase protein PrsA [Candidatus Zipacnadales bacterium]